MRHSLIALSLACLSSAAYADDCKVLLQDPDLIVQRTRDAIRERDGMLFGKLAPENQCAYDRVPQWVESMIRYCKAGWAYENALHHTENQILVPCYPIGEED